MRKKHKETESENHLFFCQQVEVALCKLSVCILSLEHAKGFTLFLDLAAYMPYLRELT